VVVVGLAMAASLLPAAPARACASSVVFLAEPAPEAHQTSPFYVAAEASSVDFTIRRSVHDCTPEAGTAGYSTVDDSAVSGLSGDFTSESGVVSFPKPGEFHEDQYAAGQIETHSDGSEESLESFTIRIDDNVTGASRGAPNQLPAYIVDRNGPDRFFLQSGAAYSQSEGFRNVTIPVFRAGPASGAADVGYTITPGSASTADYSTTSGTVSFTAGDPIGAITFSLVDDKIAETSETFTVSLNGTEVVAPSQITFTILDNEEKVDPRSRFHHPRHGLVYRRGDFRLREVHVFTSDNLSGVVRSDMALRQKLKSGRCKWWNGSKFVARACSRKLWLRMKVYETDFYYLRFPALRPSRGTRIRNYTGFSRATDRAGNVESSFTVGRNANTFEVKGG
jgi:hypothetical protein